TNRSGDSEAETELLRGENMRGVVIDHKFRNLSSMRHQRNKRRRADTFSPDRALQPSWKVRDIDVADTNRLRALYAGFPRRVALDRAPISFRQAAPGDETHHVLIVEEQNGSAMARNRREK